MREDSEVFALGVDLGGSKILTAVTDSQGNMRSRDHRVTPADKGLEAVRKRTEQLARQIERVSNELLAVQVFSTRLSKDMQWLSTRLTGLSKTTVTRGNVLASLVDEVEGLSKEQMMSQPGKINVSLLYEPLGQEKLRHFLEKVIH